MFLLFNEFQIFNVDFVLLVDWLKGIEDLFIGLVTLFLNSTENSKTYLGGKIT